MSFFALKIFFQKAYWKSLYKDLPQNNLFFLFRYIFLKILSEYFSKQKSTNFCATVNDGRIVFDQIINWEISEIHSFFFKQKSMLNFANDWKLP